MCSVTTLTLFVCESQPGHFVCESQRGHALIRFRSRDQSNARTGCMQALLNRTVRSSDKSNLLCSIDHKMLLQKLSSSLGFSFTVYSWLSYLTGRTQYVDYVDQRTDPRHVVHMEFRRNRKDQCLVPSLLCSTSPKSEISSKRTT